MTERDAGLEVALAAVNALRRRADAEAARCRPHVEAVLDALYATSRRLAVYGSLAPGEANHRALADLSGVWSDGYVRGEYSPTGWGATMGFPAMRWRPDGRRIPVGLLVADALPEHWERLDAFEGAEYCRVLVPVFRDEAIVAVANIYEAR